MKQTTARLTTRNGKNREKWQLFAASPVTGRYSVAGLHRFSFSWMIRESEDLS